jgi:hypothetical protein
VPGGHVDLARPLLLAEQVADAHVLAALPTVLEGHDDLAALGGVRAHVDDHDHRPVGLDDEHRFAPGTAETPQRQPHRAAHPNLPWRIVSERPADLRPTRP